MLAAYRTASGKSLSRIELFARLQDRFPKQRAKTLIVLAGRAPRESLFST